MLSANNYRLRNHVFCGPMALELSAARGCRVKKCDFQDCTITVEKAADCLICKCTFERVAFTLSAGADVHFEACTFLDCEGLVGLQEAGCTFEDCEGVDQHGV